MDSRNPESKLFAVAGNLKDKVSEIIRLKAQLEAEDDPAKKQELQQKIDVKVEGYAKVIADKVYPKSWPGRSLFIEGVRGYLQDPQALVEQGSSVVEKVGQLITGVREKEQRKKQEKAEKKKFADGVRKEQLLQRFNELQNEAKNAATPLQAKDIREQAEAVRKQLLELENISKRKAKPAAAAPPQAQTNDADKEAAIQNEIDKDKQELEGLTQRLTQLNQDANTPRTEQDKQDMERAKELKGRIASNERKLGTGSRFGGFGYRIGIDREDLSNLSDAELIEQTNDLQNEYAKGKWLLENGDMTDTERRDFKSKLGVIENQIQNRSGELIKRNDQNLSGRKEKARSGPKKTPNSNKSPENEPLSTEAAENFREMEQHNLEWRDELNRRKEHYLKKKGSEDPKERADAVIQLKKIEKDIEGIDRSLKDMRNAMSNGAPPPPRQETQSLSPQAQEEVEKQDRLASAHEENANRLAEEANKATDDATKAELNMRARGYRQEAKRARETAEKIKNGEQYRPSDMFGNAAAPTPSVRQTPAAEKKSLQEERSKLLAQLTYDDVERNREINEQIEELDLKIDNIENNQIQSTQTASQPLNTEMADQMGGGGSADDMNDFDEEDEDDFVLSQARPRSNKQSNAPTQQGQQAPTQRAAPTVPNQPQANAANQQGAGQQQPRQSNLPAQPPGQRNAIPAQPQAPRGQPNQPPAVPGAANQQAQQPKPRDWKWLSDPDFTAKEEVKLLAKAAVNLAKPEVQVARIGANIVGYGPWAVFGAIMDGVKKGQGGGGEGGQRAA